VIIDSDDIKLKILKNTPTNIVIINNKTINNNDQKEEIIKESKYKNEILIFKDEINKNDIILNESFINTEEFK